MREVNGKELYKGMDFIDDVHSGKYLDKEMVIEARRLELEFFRKMMKNAEKDQT